MLLAAQSMAVGTVMVRWVQKYVDPVMATGWHMALGGIPLLLLSAQNEADVYTHVRASPAGYSDEQVANRMVTLRARCVHAHVQLGELGGWDWASLAYITILGSAAAYGLFFYFATKGNLTQLSVLTFTTPMFATLFGFLLLGETLSGTQALGAAVTLAGIALTTASSKAEAAKERGS
jgi:drug/metabolite transporter (DMT)-like permease